MIYIYMCISCNIHNDTDDGEFQKFFFGSQPLPRSIVGNVNDAWMPEMKPRS